MVHLVRGESGDARPSGSPNPSSFRLALEETGMGLVTWPFPIPGWHGGVSPSSPGTGGRGASSRKLLLGSGRRGTNTALLMVRELFSLSLEIFFLLPVPLSNQRGLSFSLKSAGAHLSLLSLIRTSVPRRDFAGAPGRAPAPAPGSARSGSPGPPRAGPGVGEHGESRGTGGG